MTLEAATGEKPKKKAKKEYSHPDFLGMSLKVGDLVAFSQGATTTMALGKIIGFTEKNISLVGIEIKGTRIAVGRYSTKKSISRSPSQVVRLSETAQEFNDLPQEYVQHFFNS